MITYAQTRCESPVVCQSQLWNHVYVGLTLLFFQTYSGTPAWKRLIDHRPLASSERISLIANIFSDHKEMEIVKKLHGDDAQSFVDVTDEVIHPAIPSLSFLLFSDRCWRT